MIRVHLLRHAEPDYATLALRDGRFGGNRRDFAPLSVAGRNRAAEVARELNASTTAEMVVSSPYTRALETAAAVAAETRLPLRVLSELHDWLAVTDGFSRIDEQIVDHAIERYLRGDFVDAGFETAPEVRDRMLGVVMQLAADGVGEAIVVSHQEPICRIAGVEELEMGAYVTRDFSQDGVRDLSRGDGSEVGRDARPS